MGFPSYISPSGEVTGAHDVSFLGTGGAYVTIGFGGDPAQRGVFGPDGALFGTLVQVPASGSWRPVADIAAHEGLVNPAGDRVDTNPYGLLVEPGGAAGERCGSQCAARGQTQRARSRPWRCSRRAQRAAPTPCRPGS